MRIAVLVLLVLVASCGRKERSESGQSAYASERATHKIGDANAAHTIVESCSLASPRCARAHTKIEAALASLIRETKVRYEFRHVATPPLEMSDLASVSADCVGGEINSDGKLLEFISAAYAAQSDWAFSDDPIGGMKRLTEKIGVDQKKFDACRVEKRRNNRIQKAIAGRSPEPHFLVDGVRVDLVPDDNIRQLALELDSMLQK